MSANILLTHFFSFFSFFYLEIYSLSIVRYIIIIRIILVYFLLFPLIFFLFFLYLLYIYIYIFVFFSRLIIVNPYNLVFFFDETKNYTYIIFQRILEGCTLSGPCASHFYLLFFSSFFSSYKQANTHGSTANAAGLVSFRFETLSIVFDSLIIFLVTWTSSSCVLAISSRFFLYLHSTNPYLSSFLLFFFYFFFFFFNKPWNEFLKEEGGKNLQVLNRFYKIILINFARILIIIEIIESLQDCTIEKITFPNILVSSQNSPVHDLFSNELDSKNLR